MKATVKPMEHGAQTVTSFLIVKNAKEAIEFYQKAFNAKIAVCMLSPDNNRVAYSELVIGKTHFMLGDECPEMKSLSPLSLGGAGIHLYLYAENVDTTFKTAIAAGATEVRPVMDQFYGDRTGTVTDPFGHTWTIATHVEDVSEEEIKRRFAEMVKAQA